MSKTTKEARREAQERLAQERAAQKASERRRSFIFGGITVAIVVIIAVAVAFAVNSQSKAASDVGALPKGVNTTTYGVETGVGAINGGGNFADPVKATPTGNIPVMDLYEDFQCPACKAFEDKSASTIDALTQAAKLKVIYHPMSFLDQNLNNDSSLRAASASGCAADQGRFVAYHNTIYKNQPAKEGAGYTDAQLVQFGKDAGITAPEFTTCVNDTKYTKWATNGVEREAQNRGVATTPTVFINGKELARSDYTPAGIKAAVAAASK